MATAPHQSIQDALNQFANSDPVKFKIFFRNMRKVFPQEVTEACLHYLAEHGLNTSGQQMAFWLAYPPKYMSSLLKPTVLRIEAAAKVVVAMKKADPHFFANFLRAATAAEAIDEIMRAMALLPAMGDYSALIPMLRKFCRHPEQRVRAMATQLLCELRPNKSLVERQMASDDPRVRAGAIEALWYANSADKKNLLYNASSDRHHRVVGNALVGLYLLGDSTALPKMLQLADHPEPLFRAAMAWAMGYIGDAHAIPALERLTNDSSPMVKKRAMRSLLAVQAIQLQAEEAELAAREALAKQLQENMALTAQSAPERAPEPKPEMESQPGFTPTFATL